MPARLLLIPLVLVAGMARAEPASVADAVAAAREADVVILGEIHDNPGHHAAQAAIVAALQPGALVFEMIPQAREEAVNRLRAEGAGREALAEALDWEASGWPDFAFYAPILEAAPRARVFGGGQPIEEVRRASAEGAAVVFGPDAVSYGLNLALEPEDQAAREADMLAAHCDAIPAAMLPGLVEAQRFRDAAIADAARWARATAGEGPVGVIAGTGHAHRLRGVPAMLAAAAPALTILSVAQFEEPPDPAERGDYDLYLLAPAPARDDPSAGISLRGAPTPASEDPVNAE